MVIGIGKYASEEVKDVPTKFLIYALEERFQDLSISLIKEIKLEIINRFDLEAEIIEFEMNTPFNHSLSSDEEAQVKNIYKKLAKEYHPDMVGGNDIAMQAVNKFKDLLLWKKP